MTGEDVTPGAAWPVHTALPCVTGSYMNKTHTAHRILTPPDAKL